MSSEIAHVSSEPKVETKLERIERQTRFLDSSIKIPGTKISIGADPIIGLIPYVGDLAGALASLYIIYLAAKEGADGKAVLKMFGNVWIDALLGIIPGLGIIFDLTFKANERNLKILKEHLADGKHAGSGMDYIVIALAICSALFLLFFFLVYKLIVFLFDFITSW